MAELRARTPCGDMLPASYGESTMEELDLGVVTSVTALGPTEELSAALDAAHGLGFPKANRTSGKNGARCIWFGRNQGLLIGVEPSTELGAYAALVDQSDGWCAVSLSGDDAQDVLARLVPVDLRAAHFKRGRTARTQVGHMSASITRTGPGTFMILVFRSMAATLIDELSHAMQGVASRRG